MSKHLKNGQGAVKRSASLLRELKPAEWRALLGADLVADGLSVATACEVSGASVGYVNTVLRLTPQELEAVSDGSKSLSSFHTRMRCSICGTKLAGFGNNAQPVNSGRCCDDCNDVHVIPARFRACAVAVTNRNAGHHHHDVHHHGDEGDVPHGKHSVSTLSDGQIERIVIKIGPERIWRAVDRLTQPELPLVAAE
jgi:hypothetical protein